MSRAWKVENPSPPMGWLTTEMAVNTKDLRVGDTIDGRVIVATRPGFVTLQGR